MGYVDTEYLAWSERILLKQKRCLLCTLPLRFWQRTAKIGEIHERCNRELPPKLRFAD